MRAGLMRAAGICGSSSQSLWSAELRFTPTEPDHWRSVGPSTPRRAGRASDAGKLGPAALTELGLDVGPVQEFDGRRGHRLRPGQQAAPDPLREIHTASVGTNRDVSLISNMG
jgi:hypothetical protein